MKIKSTHAHSLNLSTFFLILLSLCWFSNSYATTPSTILHLPLFSSIDATGPVKIIVTDQQPKQSVTIVASPQITQLINTSVQNHTLIIDARRLNNQPTPVLIKIHMSHSLNNLSLHGSACVQGEHLSNPNMAIMLQDSASMHLQGTNIRLLSIQKNGAGNTAVTGIHSQVLIVRGKGNGKIIVSGKTNELNVQIGGSLVLEAQHLRTETGHIRTQNNAIAYVHVVGPLHAFAYDSSNIYYYYRPSRLVQDTHASGNVLKITPDRRLVRQW